MPITPPKTKALDPGPCDHRGVVSAKLQGRGCKHGAGLHASGLQRGTNGTICRHAACHRKGWGFPCHLQVDFQCPLRFPGQNSGNRRLKSRADIPSILHFETALCSDQFIPDPKDGGLEARE